MSSISHLKFLFGSLPLGLNSSKKKGDKTVELKGRMSLSISVPLLYLKTMHGNGKFLSYKVVINMFHRVSGFHLKRAR